MNSKRFLFFLTLLASFSLTGQNPVIRDQFTADPSARVFNGKVYLYPSHDIQAPEGANLRKEWFCMADYHVFSSDDLTRWTDHGVIVSQEKVPWVDSTSYSMWAPDCVERNGKYYFYFPANKKPQAPNGRRGFGIGVAVADHPEGPYIPQPEPIQGIFGIDPNVLIDRDGQAYIYYSMGQIFVAKLKENMLELDSEPLAIPNLPDKGLKEGPWVFERNGIYYLTFPHVEHKIERLEYAMGNHPLGPFTMTGVIMDESPLNCWTSHASFLEREGQWFLFYHQNDLSPRFDKHRSTSIDSLFFNADGTIRKVTPTFRGVGLTRAGEEIHLDRYSLKSATGTSVAFLDTTHTFAGWKTLFQTPQAWVQYNSVDFSKKRFKSVRVKALAPAGGALEIRLGSPEGPVISQVDLPAQDGWQEWTVKTKKVKPEVHNLVVVSKKENPIELDWIRFE